MRGPECHPWAEKIFGGSVRVAKIFSEPSAGACAARGCAQVTADENRKARSENKSMLFAERSAAEFISGDTEGGRPPGRRQLSGGRRYVTLSGYESSVHRNIVNCVGSTTQRRTMVFGRDVTRLSQDGGGFRL